MVTEGKTPAPSSGAPGPSQAAINSSSNKPAAMLVAFSATGNKEWDSRLSHFEYCASINEWNDVQKPNF